MNKNAIVDGQIQVESPLSEPESQDIGMNVVEGLFFFAWEFNSVSNNEFDVHRRNYAPNSGTDSSRIW